MLVVGSLTYLLIISLDCSGTHSLPRSFTHSFPPSIVHLLILSTLEHSFTQSLAQWCTHSTIWTDCPLCHWLTHSNTHSPTWTPPVTAVSQQIVDPNIQDWNSWISPLTSWPLAWGPRSAVSDVLYCACAERCPRPRSWRTPQGRRFLAPSSGLPSRRTLLTEERVSCSNAHGSHGNDPKPKRQGDKVTTKAEWRHTRVENFWLLLSLTYMCVFYIFFFLLLLFAEYWGTPDDCHWGWPTAPCYNYNNLTV